MSEKEYLVTCYKCKEIDHTIAFNNFRRSIIYVADWIKDPENQFNISRDGETCHLEVWDWMPLPSTDSIVDN